MGTTIHPRWLTGFANHEVYNTCKGEGFHRAPESGLLPPQIEGG